MLINAISAKSLYKKRSDAESDPTTDVEEQSYDEENLNTDDASQTDAEQSQNEAELPKSSDGKQEIKSEDLTEVANDVNGDKEITQHDVKQNTEAEVKEVEETNEKPVGEEASDAVDTKNVENVNNVDEISKEENNLDGDLKTNEIITSELENKEDADTDKQEANDLKIESSKSNEDINGDEKTEETSSSVDETKAESSERSDSSNRPDSIKESNDKQPSVVGDKQEKSSSSAWFDINPLYLIIPIVALALIGVALAVFALYKKNLIFKKKADRNNALPKSAAVYSPVTQSEKQN